MNALPRSANGRQKCCYDAGESHRRVRTLERATCAWRPFRNVTAGFACFSAATRTPKSSSSLGSTMKQSFGPMARRPAPIASSKGCWTTVIRLTIGPRCARQAPRYARLSGLTWFRRKSHRRCYWQSDTSFYFSSNNVFSDAVPEAGPRPPARAEPRCRPSTEIVPFRDRRQYAASAADRGKHDESHARLSGSDCA